MGAGGGAYLSAFSMMFVRMEALAKGERGVLVGFIKGEVVTTPLADVVGKQKSLDPRLVALAGVLAK